MSAGATPTDKASLAALSQWQLIRMGFAKHKLAAVGLQALRARAAAGDNPQHSPAAA